MPAKFARQLGATLAPLQTFPDFHRILLRRGAEAIVIDLVHELVSQCRPTKMALDGIRVDPPQEIMANKLCALLSRSEIRDLVDVRALELVGFPVEEALAAAALKDSGLTPAQLAWVLSQMELADDMVLTGDVSVTELRRYQADLIRGLTRRAFPDS